MNPEEYNEDERRRASSARVAEEHRGHWYLRDKLYGCLRGYQREVFEKASNKNALLVMPTGTGKTIVSFSLAEHIRGSYVKAGTPKPVLFLTQTRALAYQQHRSCKKLHAAYDVETHGVINLLETKYDGKNSEEIRYVFGVTGNYLEQLRQSKLNLSHFCMVILDEAHNVTKKSAGTSIMLNFYQHEDYGRPYILGLTATPVFQAANLDEGVSKLCGLLDADFITVREEKNIREMVANEAQGDPKIISVPATKNEGRICVSVELRNVSLEVKLGLGMAAALNTATEYKHNEISANTNPSMREKLLSELRNTAHGENFYKIEAIAAMMLLLSEVLQLTETIGVAAAGDHWERKMSEISRQVDVGHLEEVIGDMNHLFRSAMEPRGSKEVELSRLIREEHDRSGDAMRILVFVQTKFECYELHCRLRKAYAAEPDFRNMIDYGYSGDDADIKGFEEGKVKVIICTTMYEEGIDIPNCSLVIRYFMNNFNIVALNQCRGRARRSGARFILMVTSVDQKKKAKENLDYSGIMKMLRELPEQRKEVAKSAWFNNYAYAERLVTHYWEKNKDAQNRIPEIHYTEVSGGFWRARVSFEVGGKSVQFKGQGKKKKDAKEELILRTCKFLDSSDLIRQSERHDVKDKAVERTLITENKSVVQYSKDRGGGVQYRVSEWKWGEKPFTDLVQRCGKNYIIDKECKVEGGRWRCTMSLKKEVGGDPTCASCDDNKEKGWGCEEEALQNTALALLWDRFNIKYEDTSAAGAEMLNDSTRVSPTTLGGSPDSTAKRLREICAKKGFSLHFDDIEEDGKWRCVVTAFGSEFCPKTLSKNAYRLWPTREEAREKSAAHALSNVPAGRGQPPPQTTLPETNTSSVGSAPKQELSNVAKLLDVCKKKGYKVRFEDIKEPGGWRCVLTAYGKEFCPRTKTAWKMWCSKEEAREKSAAHALSNMPAKGGGGGGGEYPSLTPTPPTPQSVVEELIQYCTSRGKHCTFDPVILGPREWSCIINIDDHTYGSKITHVTEAAAREASATTALSMLKNQ